MEPGKKPLVRVVKKAFDLVVWDWPTLLLFEIIYKFVLLMLLPYGQWILERAAKRAGIQYLSNQNIFLLFKNANSAMICFLFLFVFVFVVLMEVMAVIIYLDHSRRGEQIHFILLFWSAVKKSALVFLPWNVPILFVVLIIIPFTGVTLTSGTLDALRIPEFVMDFIQKNPLASILYLVILAAAYVFLIRWIFSIHEMILEGRNFVKACKESKRLIHGNKKNFIGSAIWLFLAELIFISAVIITALGILILWVRMSYQGEQALGVFWFAYVRMSNLGCVIGSVFLMVANLSLISSLYYIYQGKETKERENPLIAHSFGGRTKFILKMVCLVLFFVFYGELIKKNWDNPLLIPSTSVIAHRGGSMYAPENTMSALKFAIDSDSEFAEIDVQQTKDGELIVFHDTSFKRTAGVKKYVWEVTLAEAKTYDVGSYFSEQFTGEKIATLEEMLVASKGKIDLMIELKRNKHDKDLEKDVVELIREYKMEEECFIASMDYELLKKVKKMAPDIKTCYITILFFGDTKKLNKADYFAIEASFITQSLVSKAHDQKKLVFAWTTNQEHSMKRMLACNVDGLITDNPLLADYVAQRGGRSVLAGEIYNKFIAQRGEIINKISKFNK